MKNNTESGNLGWIREELERRLIVMRYSKAAVGQYMLVFGWIKDFQEGYGEENYSKEAGQRFISEYQLHLNHTPARFKCARTVVRRMDEILENKLFAPRFCEAKQNCPLCFSKWFDKYIESLEKHGYRKSTVAIRMRNAARLLNRLRGAVSSLEDLTAADLYGIFTQYEWTSVTRDSTKNLLLFLFENGVTKSDLSACVPKLRRPQPLPSVYTGKEVARLLSSVDRTTDIGKRDYAIIILAAHLGLRSSDIVNLSFRDIDIKTKTIGITQVKTLRPITLVMNNDVEEAINDYIRNGRPETSSDKIFINSRAPYAPLGASAGYEIARRHFSRAGIEEQGRRKGTRALHASFTSALIRNGVPYAVVQEAMGHEDPESAKYYVRVDVSRLRACALDVPKPAGFFAVLLNDSEGHCDK
jgi:integrase